MKKILIILNLLIIACSNNVSQVDTAQEGQHEKHEMDTAKAAIALQLNNGAKWKTDEATRKNVAELIRIIKNSGTESTARLTKQVQARIDTLVAQCAMQGPGHDVLHTWLEQVLNDLKELKEKDEDQKSRAALTKDVESFYTVFE